MEFTEKQKIIFGLDLGQSHDYSALCGTLITQGFINDAFEGKVTKGDAEVLIRYLKRYPLNTSYPDIVHDVSMILERVKEEEGIRPILVIDFTGVGRPVYDMFKKTGLHPYGISIHGGSAVTREGNIYNVPKRDLVGVLQVLYQNQRIRLSGKIPEKKILNDELLNMKVKVSDTGHDTYEAWRSRDHDDMVLSVACACWIAERVRKKVKAVQGLPSVKDRQAKIKKIDRGFLSSSFKR